MTPTSDALEDQPIPEDPPLLKTVQYVVLDVGGPDDMPVVIGAWPTYNEALTWAAIYHIQPIGQNPEVAVMALWHPVHYLEQTGQ